METLSERRTSSGRPHASVSAGLDEKEVPCRENDADLWFADAPDDLSRAQELCRECWHRPDCLAGALRRAEPWGVWGGELFDQGVPVPGKRRRGRPRKNDHEYQIAQRRFDARLRHEHRSAGDRPDIDDRDDEAVA